MMRRLDRVINYDTGEDMKGVDPVRMTRRGTPQFRSLMTGLILIWGMVSPVQPSALSASSGGSAGAVPPDWVNTESDQFPRERYLTGVGYGESRKAAEDEAYAAISRIFQANIRSKTQDWEQYLQATGSDTDQKGEPQISRKIWIDQLTQVSTNKVLENVSIAEIWTDPHSQRTYALAVMERAHSATVIRGRIEELDHQARALFESATKGGLPERPITSESRLQTVRELHGAIKALLLRESLNTDLKIIDPTGEGLKVLLPIAQVGQLLRHFLSRDFHLALVIKGPYPEKIRSALLQGLTREGLVVIDRSGSGGNGEETSAGPPEAGEEGKIGEDVLVKGQMELKALELQGRPFFRWSVEFTLIDQSSDRIFGSVTRSGREGHLNAAEAKARAVRAAQRVMEEEVGPALAGIIFGTD